MYTQNISTRTIQARVVGTTFNGRQAVVTQLQQGEKVILERDPHNPYDCHAIKVVRQDGQQVGFLDRNLAASLAAKLDQFGRPVKAIVSAVTGGYYADSNLGVIIQFDLPE